MSQAVTSLDTATKSKEWTKFLTERASLASPHPKSAITRSDDLQTEEIPVIWPININIGLMIRNIFKTKGRERHLPDLRL